jgi:hypothetical protein
VSVILKIRRHMMKKMLLAPMVSVGFLVSCGGGGGPGVEDFSTVYLTSSVAKSSINVDLVDLATDNTTTPPSCKQTIPMPDDEKQTLTVAVSSLPNLPSGTQASDVVISDLKISFTPSSGNLDTCFKNVAQPSSYYVIKPGDSLSLDLTVITKDIKDCMVRNHLTSDNGCTTASFDFSQDPNKSNFYIVYATLTYKATEVYTGRSKTTTVNLGSYTLSDF